MCSRIRALYGISAPAKLNLFLHVTARRADGYHLLESVFTLIDWQDTLHFEMRGDARITREILPTSTVALPEDPQADLSVRAALALQQASACGRGVHISVDKHIPTQAGLGGGSSNAASTLLALTRLWNLHLSRAQLQQLALQLGADVPFFLCGSAAAWVAGIGDAITPLQGAAALPRQRLIVVKPAAGLETARIFAAPALTRNAPPASLHAFAQNPWGYGHNALQSVAEALQPQVRQARRWLQAAHLHPRMTGSGSAVFAPLPSGSALTGGCCLPAGWRSRICYNLDAHPLDAW